MAGDKPGMTIAVVGPQGCGKTTALGQLCHESGAFGKEGHEQCQDLAAEFGRPDQRHGWMLDRLPVERERGLTVEPSMQSFSSQAFSFLAVDTPGNADYARNMLAVTSVSDVAVLVVSAAQGEWEASLESGRARELALGCFTMGIKNIAVWVTKMDDVSVQFSSSRFEDIKKAVSAFLKEVGYKQKDVPCVPISGLAGENLTSKSAEMSWYTGQTAIESLDAVGPINRPADKPLRLPVLKVHDVPDVGTVVVGRVETGSIRPGIKVIFSPGGFVGEVKSVQKDGAKVSEATGGEVVGVALDGVEVSEISRGMVLSGSNDPASDAETFVAQVVVLDHPGKIRAGYCPVIDLHTAQVSCEFEELLAKIDRKTGKESGEVPLFAETGEVVSVKLRPRAPVCLETFSSYPSLGRFAIRDHGRTVGVGVIKEVTKRPVPKPRRKDENQYFDQ
eukprot:TRINITY_DN14350_c1_g3_i2.p1 TRINITY_DN14350_c1_g3~~TRINITY_DN14350_c1_g3_i2.p1  ORF type:complete len:447 (-),score=73.58 TRINITY_DN14350_c1_g3_i2:99-1439(-)